MDVDEQSLPIRQRPQTPPTATAADENASVAITANGETVQGGSSITWEAGENVVEVTVTNGTATKTYTITVTKED